MAANELIYYNYSILISPLIKVKPFERITDVPGQFGHSAFGQMSHHLFLSVWPYRHIVVVAPSFRLMEMEMAWEMGKWGEGDGEGKLAAARTSAIKSSWVCFSHKFINLVSHL